MISLANTQGTVKIRLAGSKVLLLIDYCDRIDYEIILRIHCDGYIKGEKYLILRIHCDDYIKGEKYLFFTKIGEAKTVQKER